MPHHMPHLLRVLGCLLLACAAALAVAQTPAHPPQPGIPAVQAPGAASTWFTVVGDPADPKIDTIQVDPVDHDQNRKTLRVRASRATVRTGYDELPYRSYDASVLMDCQAKTARFLTIAYYVQPLWQGTPRETVDFSKGSSRNMVFRGVEPNPHLRIVQAACGSR
jgi:hypothetical protein